MNWMFWGWFIASLGAPSLSWIQALALTIWLLSLRIGYHMFYLEDIWDYIDLSYDRNVARLIHATQAMVIVILVWGVGALLSLFT